MSNKPESDARLAQAAGSDVAPATPEVKESTAEGALAAFKVIVENFTPPGYTTRDSTAHPNAKAHGVERGK